MICEQIFFFIFLSHKSDIFRFAENLFLFFHFEKVCLLFFRYNYVKNKKKQQQKQVAFYEHREWKFKYTKKIYIY